MFSEFFQEYSKLFKSFLSVDFLKENQYNVQVMVKILILI